jgi:hypothetical protein
MNDLVSRLGVGVAFLMCLNGCGRSTTEPAPYYEITFDVDLSEQSVGGVTQIELVSTVRNVGSLAVHHPDWYGHGPYLRLYDSAGEQISLRNECDPLPGAPAVEVSLEPGESLTLTLGFNGTIWQACAAQRLPAGQYEFVLQFFYLKADEEPVTLTVTKDFNWPAPGLVTPK